MEDYLWTRCKFNKPSHSYFKFPDEDVLDKVLENFYLPIFPIFTKKLTRFVTAPRMFWPSRLRGSHLEAAHSLEDIKEVTTQETLLPTEDGFKLGTKMGHLLDSNIGGAQDMIYSRFFEGLARHLNVPSASDAVRLLSQYSYGNDFFFDEVVKPGPLFIATSTNDTELERKILEIYEMATESAKGLDKGTSRSIMLSCSWKELGECWTKIASEQGICYTDYKAGLWVRLK